MPPLLNPLRRVAASEFTKNGVLVFGAILGGNALNYLFYMQLGRVLSVRDYGAVMSLVSGMLLVFSIATVLQTIVAKLAADIRVTDDLDTIAALSAAVSRLSIWAGVVVTAIIVASARAISDYLHIGDAWLVILVGVTTGVGFVVLFQRGLFQGLGTFNKFGISSLLDGLKAFVVMPLTLWFGVMGSLLAMSVATVAAALYGGTALRRSARGTNVPVRLDLRRMMITAGMTGFPTLAITFLMFYDVVLARHFLSANDAGLYGAAALVGRVLFTVIAFLPIVLLPHVAHRSAQGRSQVHLLFYALAGAAIFIGGIALVSVASPNLVIYVLAGKKFLPAASIVLPYVLAAGALSIANILSTYSIACHRFRFSPYLMVVGICEVVLVSVRHGSSAEVVSDILAGHAAVLCVMTISTAVDLASSRSSVTAAA